MATAPASIASWGAVTYAGIFSASTGGDLLAYGALTTSYDIGNATTFSFSAGALSLALN